MESEPLIYDYAIIGAGAAGLQLAKQLSDDQHFHKCKILLLDKTVKSGNDHTWSFWEKGVGPYDSILWNAWSKAAFYGPNQSKILSLNPYAYKTIRSKDFYRFMKHNLNGEIIHWFTENVIAVDSRNEGVQIKTDSNIYLAKHCFDSRLSQNYQRQKADYPYILQHFKGLFIKTSEPVFDPLQMVMMDYRLKHQDRTSFTYVLPKSSFEALVEFTLFDDQLLEKGQYDTYIERYIKEYLGIDDYQIVEEEFGVIPMSAYPFWKDNSEHITKIGTAGGWVRSSSGYAFHRSYLNTLQILQNIKTSKPMTYGIYNGSQHWLDKIFLSVLEQENSKGPAIFEAIYLKNTIQSTFQFLDDNATIWNKIQMIFSVPWGPFLRAFTRQIKTIF